jgi:15-cis-phytoene synthase
MRNHQADPQAIMNAHAKSFSWAAYFLARQTRQQAAQLYAFARLMDDLVDEEALGTLPERMISFCQHRDAVLGMPSSLARSSEVGQMLKALKVDQQVIESFLKALAADTQERHLQNLTEVMHFAYGVAGTVGQMMRPILQASPQAERHAVLLGMAMQLTNIARDVMEDAHRGRCYLPADSLPADWQLARLSEGCKTTQEQAFRSVQLLLAEADALYAQAALGFDAIPMPNRRAIKIACALYQGIGHKIMRMSSEQYWLQRVHLTAWEKSRLVFDVLLGRQPESSAENASIFSQHEQMLLHIPGFPSA